MIFLDNASTTKLSKRAKNELIEGAENFINPSASYSAGLDNKKIIEDAKKIILQTLKVQYKENLIFTASATEANNLAVFGSARAGKEQYLFSAGEHLCVHNCAEELKNRGYNVKFIPLTEDGVIDFQIFEEMLKEPTAFVSCLHVSNETGAINDIEKISNLTKSKWPNAIFHSDGVQAFGKIDVNLSKLKNVDLYTISAHKINGPKGIGALYVKNKNKLKTLIFGGGQEYNLRSGTENLPSICAFREAALERCENLKNNLEKVQKLNRIFRAEIEKHSLTDINFNSAQVNSPYILNISFVGIKGETLVRMCDDDGLLVGTGSACSSKKTTLNRILLAMGKTKAETEGAIRVSFSHENTEDEVVRAAEILVKNFLQLKSMLA